MDKEPEDAPVHYSAEAASAWAAGYNAGYVAGVLEAQNRIAEGFEAEPDRIERLKAEYERLSAETYALYQEETEAHNRWSSKREQAYLVRQTLDDAIREASGVQG